MELASSLICSHLTAFGNRCTYRAVGEVNLKSFCKLHSPDRKFAKPKTPSKHRDHCIKWAAADLYGQSYKLSYTASGLKKVNGVK